MAVGHNTKWGGFPTILLSIGATIDPFDMSQIMIWKQAIHFCLHCSKEDFLWIIFPPSPILSVYLNTCQYANLFLSPIHPRQKHNIALFHRKSNYNIAQVKKKIIKAQFLTKLNRLLILLNEQFPILASWLDFPHYLIFLTAGLSELVINWTPLVGGCIKSRDFVNFEFILDIIWILNIATEYSY